MASNYPQPPPLYSGPKTTIPADEEAGQPLLSPRAGSSSGAYYDQPLAGDIPDDFKVSYIRSVVIAAAQSVYAVRDVRIRQCTGN